MGVDTLADYSEFVFDTNTIIHINPYSTKQIGLLHQDFEPM